MKKEFTKAEQLIVNSFFIGAAAFQRQPRLFGCSDCLSRHLYRYVSAVQDYLFTFLLRLGLVNLLLTVPYLVRTERTL